MGVPALFSTIARNHTTVLKNFDRNRQNINNAYFDSNSIIYDEVRVMEKEGLSHKNDRISFEDCLIKRVCDKISSYIKILKPDDSVIIAFDGVAPCAKLEQQRQRRYKSIFTQKLLEKDGYENKSWDTTSITPGTGFMKRLDVRLKTYFKNPNKFGLKTLIISSGMEVGEGEHKIFEHIRNKPDKHLNSHNVVYGLDADLIMLSINHLRFSENLYLFRETPSFAKSLNASLEPNELYILDINQLFKRLCIEMNDGKEVDKVFQVNRAYDYIFMCLILGNDFVPHNPAINIRSKGMSYLMNAYSQVVALNNENLTDGAKINWRVFRKFISFLAENEEEYLITEHKMRDAFEKRPPSFKTDEPEIIQQLNAIPIKKREKENYINPKDANWQERYYRTLFDAEKEDIPNICMEYLRVLEWTLKYYTSGCVDWRFTYNYAYAPLLQDLVKYIPVFDTEVIETSNRGAVSPMTQLCYVLPEEAHYLLPEEIRHQLQKDFGDYFINNYEFEWSYCRYFWECHVNMNQLDIERLEVLTSRFERKINKNGIIRTNKIK